MMFNQSENKIVLKKAQCQVFFKTFFIPLHKCIKNKDINFSFCTYYISDIYGSFQTTI